MTSLQRAAWSHAPGGVQLSVTGENALYHCIIHSYLVPGLLVNINTCALKTTIILQNQFVAKQNQQNATN